VYIHTAYHTGWHTGGRTADCTEIEKGWDLTHCQASWEVFL